MSRRRYISTAISLDKAVNRLALEAGDFAALLYTWMIPHAEDSAHITADPEEILYMVVPGRRDKTVEDVEAALLHMASLGLIAWMRGEGSIYFDTDSFYRYQAYIPAAKRADNSAHFADIGDNNKKAPEVAQKAASLSLSLSPSPTRARTQVDADAPTGADVRADFAEWWREYGKIGDVSRARDLYTWWRMVKKASRDDLLAGAVNYRSHCGNTDCKMKHGATFLAKPTKSKSAIWPEWSAGEEHGDMNARATRNLSDVLIAGAQAFGLTGDDYERLGSAEDEEDDGPAGTPAGGTDAERGLPACELAG